MPGETRLKGKRILVVDDEPDILDTLENLLPMCEVEKAGTFESAKERIESRPFDIAILDIMGVDGYKLLDLAKKKGIIPVMLTAHALSVDDTIRSFKSGAASYLPKDQMKDIDVYLQDILEAKEKGAALVVALAREARRLLRKEIRRELAGQGEGVLAEFPVVVKAAGKLGGLKQEGFTAEAQRTQRRSFCLTGDTVRQNIAPQSKPQP